jgi:hypothetical protein
MVTGPLAAITAWRTWVHARRRLEGVASFRGVAEAAGCGFAIALIVLAPGIIFKPLEAPPYVIFYGGVAIIFGALVGAVLHAAALAAMRLARPRSATPT